MCLAILFAPCHNEWRSDEIRVDVSDKSGYEAPSIFAATLLGHNIARNIFSDYLICRSSQATHCLGLATVWSAVCGCGNYCIIPCQLEG